MKSDFIIKSTNSPAIHQMFNTSASAFVPATPPTKRADTLYGTTMSAKQSVPSDVEIKFQTKYKTELCKNWIEVGLCRYGDSCKFAHGHSEVILPKLALAKKDKNCKTFFKTGQCPYGVRCQYDHEHRHMEQIKRYHHTVRLITLESLFANSIDQSASLQTYESQAPRMPIFQQIHAEGDKLATEKLSSIAESQDEMSDSAESTVGSSGESAFENQHFCLSD